MGNDTGARDLGSRREALRDLCEEHRLSAVYAFGSRALEAREWIEGKRAPLDTGPSDLDLGVRVTGRAPTVRDKVEAALGFEDLFGANRVDLVLLLEADPFLAAEIIRGERLFARDGHEADEYELYVLRRAGDLAPLERERLALILEGRG